MEPRIQYAKTSDGVNIAYGEAGTGTAVILWAPAGFGHSEMAWRVFANLLHPLATQFRVIWFDSRGTGLSDRDAIDFSLDAMSRDLEAVVQHTAVDSFVLAAWTASVPCALTYAVSHPDRLSQLILCDGWASYSDWGEGPANKASLALLELDWFLFTETFGQVVWAFADSTFGRIFAQLMQASAEPEAHRAIWKAWERYDVRELLPQVTTPTLVVHSRNNRLFPLAIGRRLAAAIPGARLTLIEDDASYASVPGLLESFVSQPQAKADAGSALPSGMTAILFADIAESTGLTERMGDAAFRARARELDGALRSVIRENGGTPIEGKLLGDGVLAVFTSARQAIEAALACGKSGDDAGLPLHLGLHAGDVIREDNNIYGGAVNIASRISGLSAAGEVLVSETVRLLARTSAGVRFEDRGEQSLKGVGEPVRVWAVEGERSPSTDSGRTD
jgi:class 3 adenylate cyclase/pimeloyl-ACP methyl ester carboxylesterase